MARLLLKILLVAAVAVGLSLALLLLLFPAHRLPADGDADPALGLRRAVIGFLADTGISNPDAGPLWGDPRLPFEMRAETRDTVTELRREPVYRGLLWLVGQRVTIRRREPAGASTPGRVLRIACSVGGERETVVERGEPGAGSPDEAVVWELCGFVPERASELWLEEELPGGARHMLSAWIAE
jgi:hypothetical protein